MDIFDEDLFQKGLAQRKATMGADFVEKKPSQRRRLHPPLARSHDRLGLGIWLGRRHLGSKNTILDEPCHARRLGQDA